MGNENSQEAAGRSRSSVGTLPSPPPYHLWPPTVQHAMRLRGALLPCGPGVRGAAWPENERVRLSALGAWLVKPFAASHLTAAWVWGATEQPPSPLTAAAAAGHHTRRSNPEVRYYELRLAANDIVHFGDFGVTSRTRTFTDLLYDPLHFGDLERDACRALFASMPAEQDELVRRIRTVRRPQSVLARQRLAEVLAS